MAPKSNTIVDPSAVAKMLSKKDSTTTKVKIKKPAPKPKSEIEPPSSPKSPLLNNLDAQLRSTFDTGRPMEDSPTLIQCKTCKKPMLQSVAHKHIKACLERKQEKVEKKKQQKEANRKAREARDKAGKAEKDAQDADSDDESTVGDKAGAKKAVKSATGKKRKADTEAEKNPKKKTKKELEAAKPKTAKPKGPVDVEKQCGVLLPNGAMCARSLTCKSHAMGAKRAVPGRSQPYDYLLAAYQKKNQAKQQKAAMDANAPLPEDQQENQEPIDSDEEKDQVMAGIARCRPQPLAQHYPINMRVAYQTMRIKNEMRSAFSSLFNSRATGAGAMGPPSTAEASSAGAAQNDAVEARRTSVAAAGSKSGGVPTPTTGGSKKNSISAASAAVTAGTPVSANA